MQVIIENDIGSPGRGKDTKRSFGVLVGIYGGVIKRREKGPPSLKVRVIVPDEPIFAKYAFSWTYVRVARGVTPDEKAKASMDD